MIALNTLEKIFLRRLVELSQRTNNVYLGNLVDDTLVNVDVALNVISGSAEFRFDSQIFINDPLVTEIVRENTWRFMRFVRLLNYLESMNYLYLFQESPIQNEFRFGQLITMPVNKPDEKKKFRTYFGSPFSYHNFLANRAS